jgi:hypothetical protein
MDGTMVSTKNSMCAMFCPSAGLERGESDILEPPRGDARTLPRSYAASAPHGLEPSNHRTQDHPSGHFLRIGIGATMVSPDDPGR